MSTDQANKVSAERINVGIMGHVDAGKSTLTGHLVYLTKQLSEHEFKKLKDEAVKLKDESFKFAYYTDKTIQQRTRGVTIQSTLLEFKTPNRTYNIVDLPGHADYAKNFITSANSVNLALLLISADDGITSQTLEHARIIIANGVKRMIIAVNKMDIDSVKYSEARFNQIKQKILPVVTKFLDFVTIVPISAVKGENLTANSNNMQWYTGKPLIEILDEQPYPQIDKSKPFRLQVSEVHSKSGIGIVVVGNVTQGVVKVNDTVIVKPADKKGEIKSIETFFKTIDYAQEGDSVGCVIRGIAKEDVKKGHILSPVKDTPVNVVAVEVDLNMVNAQISLRQASDIIMHYGTGNTAARIQKIYYIKDNADNIIADSSKEQSKNFKIVRGNVARVRLVPIKTIAMQLAQHNPKLGTLILRNEKGVLAFASVVKLIPHQNENVDPSKCESFKL